MSFMTDDAFFGFKNMLSTENSYKRRDRIFVLLLLAFGIISSQRFIVPEASGIICIIIIILPVVVGLDFRSMATFLLISLLGMVDLGGGVYSETPAAVKYTIYLCASLYIFAISNFRSGRNLIYLLPFVFLMVINTLVHPNKIDPYTFARDCVTLIFITLVSTASSSKVGQNLKYPYLLAFSIGLIASELVNMLFFYSVSSGEYLNYSSFKFVALLPLVYYLSFKNYKYAALAFPLVLAVVSAFGSRMLLLTGIVVIALLVIRGASGGIFRTLGLIFSVASILIVLAFYSNIDLESYRVLTALTGIVDFADFASLAMFLDPVRYAENSVFFGQNIYHLLFGNGLGAGILDSSGIFAFVPDDGAAFSSKELSEAHFFRLHDSWTWFGYRFGLLAYILFVAWGIKGCLNKDSTIAFSASLMLLALLNSTFSIGGLVVCAFFALQYKLRLQRYDVERYFLRPVSAHNS